MKFEVHNTKIEKVGQVELPDAVFAATVKEGLLWEQVRAQRASRRRGTHKVKSRAEVAGSGTKPFKQKGTGRARQGSEQAPNHVGGGISMGPRPRDYSYRLPRSARKAALCSALSLRTGEKNLLVLDGFDLEAPRTKEVVSFLEALGSKSALIVDGGNANLKLSARNLPGTKYLEADALNIYDILNHEKLVVTQAALTAIIRKAGAAGATEGGAS